MSWDQPEDASDQEHLGQAGFQAVWLKIITHTKNGQGKFIRSELSCFRIGRVPLNSGECCVSREIPLSLCMRVLFGFMIKSLFLFFVILVFHVKKDERKREIKGGQRYLFERWTCREPFLFEREIGKLTVRPAFCFERLGAGFPISCHVPIFMLTELV